MKKVLKLSFVLATFVFAISCNNIKSTGLIGTYKSDAGVQMTVSSTGYVDFSIDRSKDRKDLKGVALALEGGKKEVSGKTYNHDGLDCNLGNWDLTADKNQNYEVTEKVTVTVQAETPYRQGEEDAPTYPEVTRKFAFTKDGTSIKCVVTVEGLDAKMAGENGEITFTK